MRSKTLILDRINNENEEQYLWRVGQAKDCGLITETWDKIARYINLEFREDDDWVGESVYRKSYTEWKKAYEAGVFNHDTSDELEELRQERMRLQTENLERTRYDREVARHSLFYDKVRNVASALPLPKFELLYSPNQLGKNVNYLVCLADIHYGASFTSMNNKYSPEIFRERLEILAYDLIDFINDKKINTITIAELGDTIQGILRISDLKLNETSVVKSVVDISRYLAQFLNQLSTHVKIEYYHVGAANHTQVRPLGTKANQMADEDLEYVIGNYIKDLLQNNKRVNVHLVDGGQDFIDIDGFGFKIVASHGHRFNNLETAVRDLTMLRGEFIDYLVVGHYHNGKNMDVSEGATHNAELLCCPSFVGSDNYSDSIMKGSKAAVAVFGFDDINGHTETYKFILN